MYGNNSPFILLLNAQGFIKHKDKIENLIILTKPEILCLTETHLTNEIDESEVNIENYGMIRCNSSNSRTEGVLILVKKNIKYKVISNKNIEENA